ncbi:MAG: 4-hydroxy-3-methylbut-2-enyl diphosphate reductase [Cyanosarcina radialis HA8281-LM2]|jgi:4-hydroxy-3-methylbut-2-enyl diphosphate reductase|nr:4-hydroxy-3-methylbut-2-enyl diphosphate reductase [Cyanosarcina radialis HA8281-LM2]
MDNKVLNRSLHQSDRYYRHGFGGSADLKQQLRFQYDSDLMPQIRERGYVLQQGEVTIRLAEAMGFCWGVERAIALAYETRQQFPSACIWITNEIIHNPRVNQSLKDRQIRFIPVDSRGEKDFSVMSADDVVILPAFGATVEEMQLLHQKGCIIADTTCPWVAKVWNRVEKHQQGNFTSIVHGKYNHEETLATRSHAEKYLVLLNLSEAEYVCNYILRGGNRDAFLSKFALACSPGFDPDTDLVKIGIANQTTMLKGETEQIGKLFERTLMRKYGFSDIDRHFLSFNTICNATQERQDAMLKLMAEKLDLVLVVGGFNSSNTAHLLEIACQRGIPAYHIDSAERIGVGNWIQHQPLHQALTVTEDWLPPGPVAVGITSGASTPDNAVAAAIEKILHLKNCF